MKTDLARDIPMGAYAVLTNDSRTRRVESLDLDASGLVRFEDGQVVNGMINADWDDYSYNFFSSQDRLG